MGDFILPKIYGVGYGNLFLIQMQIAELQKQHDLLRLTCLSLSRCHAKAVEVAGKDGLS